MSSATFMVKLLITNMRFIAYLFPSVRVLGWKMLNLTLEFVKPISCRPAWANTGIELDDPAGGIFLWVKFPDAIDTTRLTQTALQSGVAINPGAEWMTDANIGQRRVRL
jgi:hypothetical protein